MEARRFPRLDRNRLRSMAIPRYEAIKLIRLRVLALSILVASVAYLVLTDWSVDPGCQPSARGVTELFTPTLSDACLLKTQRDDTELR